jgi:hypothetical protein
LFILVPGHYDKIKGHVFFHMTLMVVIPVVMINNLPFGSGLHRNQTFTLSTLAGQFARASDSFGLFTGAFFRWLFIMAAKFHFTENAFALHLFLQRFQRLINVIVANYYLHKYRPVLVTVKIWRIVT